MTGKATNQRDLTDVIKKQKRDLKKTSGIVRAQASGISGAETAIASGTKTQAGGAGTANTNADLLMNTFDIRDVDRLYFSTTAGSTDKLTANDHGIEAASYYDGTTYYSVGMNYRIPSPAPGMGHYFMIGSEQCLTVRNDRIDVKKPLRLTTDTATGSYLSGSMYYDGTDIQAVVPAGTINLTSAGSSGANIQLSNLGTTSVNANVIPQAGKLLGSDGNEWARVHSNNYRLGTAGTISNSDNDIAGDAGGMTFNVPTGAAEVFDWQAGGASKMTLTSGGQLYTSILRATTVMQLDDSTSYLGSNGSIYREGNDVKIYSGGSEINMSTLGAAGANVQLSNLGTTSVNANIIPQAGKILGSSGNEWARVHTNDISFGTAGNVSAGGLEIIGDSGGMTFNIPNGAGENYEFKSNGVSIGVTLSNSGNLVVPTAQITFAAVLSDAVSYPGTNGAIYREGNDVKIFTGGTEVNMSSIGGAGATTALNNLTTTSINQSLLPSSTNSKSLGSASLQWQNLFIDGIARIDSLGFGASYSMTLPTTLGTNGQVLTTNGSSALSWTTVSGGSSGANTSLSNLTSTGESHFVKLGNTSNWTAEQNFNSGIDLGSQMINGVHDYNFGASGGKLNFNSYGYISASGSNKIYVGSAGATFKDSAVFEHSVQMNNGLTMQGGDVSLSGTGRLDLVSTGGSPGSFDGYVAIKVGGATKYIQIYS